jgi:nucleoside-diphosphate-sugar epimerase
VEPWIPGDGRAKTNPVHARDVACACVNALTAASGDSISVGGPDVMTRDDIARMACEAVGRRARIVHVPAAVLGFSSAVLGPVHPRASQLLEFAARVFTSDCVAPAVGRHRLADYFAAVVSDRP